MACQIGQRHQHACVFHILGRGHQNPFNAEYLARYDVGIVHLLSKADGDIQILRFDFRTTIRQLQVQCNFGNLDTFGLKIASEVCHCHAVFVAVRHKIPRRSKTKRQCPTGECKF
jgi:hypothetical protein